MWQCEKCSGWRLSSVTECHCKQFKVIDEDGEEYEQWAMTDEDAALKYAESYNEEGDYSLMNESVEITVNDKKFRVSAEPDIHYSANEI